MKKLALAVVAFMALIVGWNFMYPSASWRYRLTLEVETPEGVKTGSSVVEVSGNAQARITPESVASFSVKGEAIAVDLAERGVLFALLNRDADVDYPIHIVFQQFPYVHDYVFEDGTTKRLEHGGEATREGLSYYANLRAKSNLPQSQLPSLVRFRDLNDPKSVELVDASDLAKSFGAGVTLKSATIEMVDQGYWPLNQMGITGEPITRVIENRLPWLLELSSSEKQHGVYRYNDGVYRAVAEDFIR
jgi:hypothetical protein